MIAVLGTLGWLAECTAFHWLLVTFGADLSFQKSVFVFAFSMLVGAATMLPGGLGGTEATMIGLLLLCRVQSDLAFAATLIIRATTLWFAVGLGFIALAVSLYLARRRHTIV
jgi:uncharacterized protein (TIRG00374 family)